MPAANVAFSNKVISVSVVILCGVDSFLEAFMLMALDEDMTRGDYVYITTDLLPASNLLQRWVSSPPGSDAETARARLAFQPVLQVRSQ